jgi:glycosyltransferase involved in cell wall biosynthesis
MTEDSIIVVPEFEFRLFLGQKRKIDGIEFIKHESNIIINFGICKDVKNYYRIFYTFFLLKAFFSHLCLRKRRKFFVTMVQILSPNLFALFGIKGCYFGPLGGQANLFHYKLLFTNTFRIKNFITTQILYKIIFFRDPKKIFLCHPKLNTVFRSKECTIFPAITQVDEDFWTEADLERSTRNTIIFVGRKIEIKLPSITLAVFKCLAQLNPTLEFIIIGEGWEDQKISKNFQIKSKASKEMIAQLYQKSLLNVFLSFELAGYVVFEALQNGAVNFVLDGYGGDYLCTPSNDFKIKIHPKFDTDCTIKQIVEKIQDVLRDKNLLAAELKLQRNNSKKYQLKNRRELYDQFIKFN